jgi:spoIIIJ-associated protein
VTDQLAVEATGETVGEAKWRALRELELRAPGLDKAGVRFQVLSEGERGLLGVGFTPARVLAVADPVQPAAADEPRADETPVETRVRAIVTRVTGALGLRCTVDVRESDEAVTATCTGGELGLLIGKHGQTIDALQYLVNAIVARGPFERKAVVVDAAGYRDRRRQTLDGLAVRAADQVVATGRPVELEAMTSVERRLVHERLKEYPGVATASEGTEPYRHVVVLPAR